jgi:hypothetical protein
MLQRTMTIKEISAEIDKLPWWRKWLICHLQYRKWRTARAYNTVACDLLHSTRHHLGETIRELGDAKWAKLYGYEPPARKEEIDWESRAREAEYALEFVEKRLDQKDAQLTLMKNTCVGLANLRRQRPLPL